MPQTIKVQLTTKAGLKPIDALVVGQVYEAEEDTLEGMRETPEGDYVPQPWPGYSLRIIDNKFGPGSGYRIWIPVANGKVVG